MQKSTLVTISRKAKRVSLQRYLWSNLCYENKVSVRILAGLLLNQLWLEEKSVSDPDFNKKFKETLEVSSSILKEINLSHGISQKAFTAASNRAMKELEGFLVPRRNYTQWKTKFDSLVVRTTSKPLGVLKKKLPPERFIGIGYRDKGTAKNPAEDGSPSWQEVAQSNLIEQKLTLKEVENELRKTDNIDELIEIFETIAKTGRLPN